jgi:hypothetical protein
VEATPLAGQNLAPRGSMSGNNTVPPTTILSACQAPLATNILCDIAGCASNSGAIKCGSQRRVSP